MTTVRLPSPLFSYTGGLAQVDLEAESLGAVVDGLERLYPGLRFRIVDERGAIRPTILFYVDGEIVRDLARRVAGAKAIQIVAALSGG